MERCDMKSHFEQNMLDGDKVENCGKAMLSAESVWEYISDLAVINAGEKEKCTCEKFKTYKCPVCLNKLLKSPTTPPVTVELPSVEEMIPTIEYELSIHKFTEQVSRRDLGNAIRKMIEEKNK